MWPIILTLQAHVVLKAQRARVFLATVGYFTFIQKITQKGSYQNEGEGHISSNQKSQRYVIRYFKLNATKPENIKKNTFNTHGGMTAD